MGQNTFLIGPIRKRAPAFAQWTLTKHGACTASMRRLQALVGRRVSHDDLDCNFARYKDGSEKPMIKIKIDAHLLIPFGRPKWDINKIRIVGVSTTGTYFESDTPCVYIDARRPVAVRLRHFRDVFPEEFPSNKDTSEALNFIRDYLRKNCAIQTELERRFLDIYLDYCQEEVTPTAWQLKNYGRDKLPAPLNDPDWVFDALMPLPQAHLYLVDSLQDDYSFVPKNMVKVDFAFWTGKEIVAVEIDGSSHVGSESHARKDRLLQRAGVPVIHILNDELLRHQKKAVSRLLPTSITSFWSKTEDSYRSNPLKDDVPF